MGKHKNSSINNKSEIQQTFKKKWYLTIVNTATRWAIESPKIWHTTEKRKLYQFTLLHFGNVPVRQVKIQSQNLRTFIHTLNHNDIHDFTFQLIKILHNEHTKCRQYIIWGFHSNAAEDVDWVVTLCCLVNSYGHFKG